MLLAVSIIALGWLLLPTLKRAPPTAALRPFGDERVFILLEDLVWEIGDSGLALTVPSGFVTDLASTPQALWSLGYTQNGPYGRAAIIHDWLYWTQPCSRGQADRLMLKAMQESAVDPTTVSQIFVAVSRFGSKAWQSNASERASGAFRVLPPEHRRPADPNQRWAEYRRQLSSSGIQEPHVPFDPRVCDLADRIAVPSVSPAPPPLTGG
ncbi:DUF1353 domain-containing protein [Piscinibacter sakaiensis]|uniref:DUF1353 domain-containing protein n=1 Tax=Piscinibacter sakaiensis TaxID=1547922 RepID=UPI003AB0CD44